jgi:tetratricopeptide (TPR) repeat protein
MRPQVLRAFLPALAAALLVAGCASAPRGRDLALEYYAIGNAWLDMGRYEKALDAYRSALRLDPAFVKADYNLALTYARMRSTADAETILNRLLAEDPRNVTLLSTLAWAYHLGGRDGEALATYDRVLAAAPESVDAWYNSALILWKEGKKAEALERTRRMLALAPEDPQGLLAAGSLLLESGDAASAEDFLGRYIQRKPDDLEGRFLLAQALESQRAFARAIAAYDGILGRDQKQAGAWFGKARLLLTVVEDPERGLEALGRALALGFADKEAARALLASEGLKEAGSVESVLTESGLLP